MCETEVGALSSGQADLGSEPRGVVDIVILRMTLRATSIRVSHCPASVLLPQHPRGEGVHSFGGSCYCESSSTLSSDQSDSSPASAV